MAFDWYCTQSLPAISNNSLEVWVVNTTYPAVSKIYQSDSKKLKTIKMKKVSFRGSEIRGVEPDTGLIFQILLKDKIIIMEQKLLKCREDNHI